MPSDDLVIRLTERLDLIAGLLEETARDLDKALEDGALRQPGRVHAISKRYQRQAAIFRRDGAFLHNNRRGPRK